MIKELSHTEIFTFLKNNYIGRLGCSVAGKTYIIPVTYFYDEVSQSILGHTGEGMKFNMLKENPNACFQVDNIINLNDWESIIAWGKFEVIKGADAKNVLHILVNGVRELLKHSHPQVKYLSELSFTKTLEQIPILYRIKLDEISGRKMKLLPSASMYSSYHSKI